MADKKASGQWPYHALPHDGVGGGNGRGCANLRHMHLPIILLAGPSNYPHLVGTVSATHGCAWGMLTVHMHGVRMYARGRVCDGCAGWWCANVPVVFLGCEGTSLAPCTSRYDGSESAHTAKCMVEVILCC